MKHSILSNVKRQASADKSSNKKVKGTHEFLKKPGDNEKFEEQIVEDAFK